MDTHTLTSVNFPCPTGPLAIGTTMYHLIDTQRTETHAHDSAHPYRELMMQVWYPAAEGSNKKIPVDGKTYALSNVRVSDVAQHYPVLIYSHGLMGTSDENTALCEDLTSYGYVIVGITHTYASALIQFPDGRKIGPALSFGGLNYQQGQNLLNQEMEVWVADAMFVLDQLKKNNNQPNAFLYNRLDMNNVGMFGHSFGGAAAVQMLRRDNRIKASIDLDGPLNGNDSTRPFHKPCMFILGGLSETRLQDITPMPEEMLKAYNWSREDEERNMQLTLLPAVNRLTQAIGKDAYKIVIRGAKHATFTDQALLNHDELDLDVSDSILAHTIITSYVRMFFDVYLKQQNASLLNENASNWPDYVVVEKFDNVMHK